MAIKLAKLNLQTSVLPIWNPENKGYKIGYEKSWIRPSRVSKSSSENNFRILSANTVGPFFGKIRHENLKTYCSVRCSKCQGHHCTGNNQVPSIKTSSSVVEVVKLMPWRQAKSPLKIPSWSGGKMSSSHIFNNWHPPDQVGNFKGDLACLQGINLTTSNTEDDVFMDGTWLLPVQWCPWHLVNTWNTLLFIVSRGSSKSCSILRS